MPRTTLPTLMILARADITSKRGRGAEGALPRQLLDLVEEKFRETDARTGSANRKNPVDGCDNGAFRASARAGGGLFRQEPKQAIRIAKSRTHGARLSNIF